VQLKIKKFSSTKRTQNIGAKKDKRNLLILDKNAHKKHHRDIFHNMSRHRAGEMWMSKARNQ
jgi:hypothetical protein